MRMKLNVTPRDILVTVLTYMIICGVNSIIIILVLAFTAWIQMQETSDYPVNDFMNLRECPTANGNMRDPGTHDNLETVFANCAVGESGRIIEASRGLRGSCSKVGKARQCFTSDKAARSEIEIVSKGPLQKEKEGKKKEKRRKKHRLLSTIFAASSYSLVQIVPGKLPVEQFC